MNNASCFLLLFKPPKRSQWEMLFEVSFLDSLASCGGDRLPPTYHLYLLSFSCCNPAQLLKANPPFLPVSSFYLWVLGQTERPCLHIFMNINRLISRCRKNKSNVLTLVVWTKSIASEKEVPVTPAVGLEHSIRVK